VTFSSSDNIETTSQTFTWVVANGLVSVTNPGTQVTAEGANVSLQVVASDAAGDTLTYDEVGLAIDPASGVISGTIAYGTVPTSGGSFQVTGRKKRRKKRCQDPFSVFHLEKGS
jgi:hypothetical protein